MDKLTAQQVTELGDCFLLFAQAVGNYRYVNGGNLSAAQSRQIRNFHWNLLKYADDLYTGSVKLVMEAAEPALETINTITGEINDSYQTLQQVQKAIDVAAACVKLGMAIFSKEPLSISAALGNLEAAWAKKGS